MDACFSKEYIGRTLKNNLIISGKNDCEISVKPFTEFKYDVALKMSLKDGEYFNEYILIKVLNEEEALRKQIFTSSMVLKPLFVLKNAKNEVFAGYERKFFNNFRVPQKNCYEDLKVVLKKLAEYQVEVLNNVSGEVVRKGKYNVKKAADAVLSLDFFEAFDTVKVNAQMEVLEKSVDDIVASSVLVKSIGDFTGINVFVTDSKNDCKFVDKFFHHMMPLPYDALVFIFVFSNETFRQHHLQNLLNLYFKTLLDSLKNLNANKWSFTRNDFEMQVKILLSLVKFEAANYLSQNEHNSENQQELKNILENIFNLLKYPKLSKEDCVEALTQKLGTAKFQLVNYELIPLDQQNGHLGEYFTSKATVRLLNKTENLRMFTKVLASSNQQLTNIVQAGPSKHEEFFYRTFASKVKEYGLEPVFDFAPKCYFNRLNDVIIMEDMEELGFVSLKPNSKLEYRALKTVISNVARLHACSLLLEEKMSQEEGRNVRLNDLYKGFFEEWIFAVRKDMPVTPVAPIYAKSGIDHLIKTFSEIPQIISMEEFQERTDAIFATFLEKLDVSSKFRNVVCHGDLYVSNTLFKYDQNNEVIKTCLVDFQVLRYGPPVQDVLFFIYISSNNSVRQQHLSKLLEDYYEELKNILDKYGVDINTVYTKQEFFDCCKYIKPLAICQALLYAQVIMVPPEKRHELVFDEEKYKYYFLDNRREFIDFMLPISDEFKLNLKELIEDLYEVCVNKEY